MDHFSKAVDRARGEMPSVRAWMQAEKGPADPAGAPSPLEIRQVRLEPEHLRSQHVLFHPDREDLPLVDIFRLLRTRILLQMRPKEWRRLGITSAGDKEGKSFTAINLACSIARSSNERVVLIDADLRKPNVAHTLGFEAHVGLADHLVNQTPIEQVLVSPEGMANLVVLPGRRADGDLSVPELIGSEGMSAVLNEVDRRIRPAITIVDLPPVLVGDDVISIGPRLDALLLVIDEGRTSIDELTKAAELTSRFNLLGSVLNNSRQKPGRFDSYYYHGE